MAVVCRSEPGLPRTVTIVFQHKTSLYTRLVVCVFFCVVQVDYLHLQSQTSQPEFLEPFSGGTTEPDQPCLQEELHCPAKEKVNMSPFSASYLVPGHMLVDTNTQNTFWIGMSKLPIVQVITFPVGLQGPEASV